MFLQPAERFQDDYNIAGAMVAPPHTADRYGYELRLCDEAGFAYRGPLLSVVVKRELFWTMVRPWSILGALFSQYFQGYHLHIPNLDVLGSFFETTVRIYLRK